MSRCRAAIAACALLMLAGPAAAADQIVELVTGTLHLSQAQAFRTESLSVDVTLKTVTQQAVYINESGGPVSTMISLPLPDLNGATIASFGVDVNAGDNVLAAQITANGQPVTPAISQRATLLGVDMTDLIKAKGVPLLPGSQANRDAIAALDAATLADWTARGLLAINNGEDGDGRPQAMWVLQSALWWMQDVAADGKLTVKLSHTTSVGAAIYAAFAMPDATADDIESAKARYCLDDAFLAAARKMPMSALADGGGDQMWINLNLGAFPGEAASVIGTFTLHVDAGDPRNLVSACGPNVKKPGPAKLSMTATDYVPQPELPILVMGW